VYIMAIASIVGLLGTLSVWQPVFKSVLGQFLPPWILNTEYGGTIGYRSTGHYGWFAVLGPYFRVKSFFLFATLYASALAVSLPIALFLHSYARGKGEKLLLKGVILLLLVNLLFTTSRVATLSFLLGGFYFLTFVSRKQRLSRWLLVFLVLAMGLILLADIFQDGSSIIAETAAEYLERLAQARTSGDVRMAVYGYTLAGVAQRPLFGWGTERDVPEFHLPAGSHNHYLAVLYRHGIAGFLAFLGVLWSLWKETRPPAQKRGADLGNPLFAKLLQYGRWVIVTALLDGVATVPITDATTMVTVWLIFSLLIASNRLCKEAGNIQING
jgi:O-antigen ligase